MSVSASRCRRFFAEWLALHPEEASSFGERQYAARLELPTEAAAGHELRWLREVEREAAEVLADERLAPSTRLDLDAVARVASFFRHRLERDADASNIELACLPNAALQHQALHLEDGADTRALAARASAVRPFLEAVAENLRRGLRAGQTPDRDVARLFVERIVPGAARAVEALGPRVGAPADEARDAYLAFGRFVEGVVLPAAKTEVVLGAEEVGFRLRTMGVSDDASTLLASARKDLVRSGDEMMAHARALGHDVASVADVRHVVASLLARRPASIEDALDGYRRALDAATRFVEERGIVSLPSELALALEPLPAGIADGTPLTNWTAPLLDPHGKGHILYCPDVGAHAEVATKNLAVHEGIPGHYLQSVVWQRTRAEGALCRWIGSHDDVAMSRQYFGAMLAIEGWAVHMEHELRRHGFYDDGPEALFFAVCDAIRAARVVLDLEIHAGEMTSEQATTFVEQTTAMPRSWAAWQALRCRRAPLQGLTYFVGAVEIDALQARMGAPPRVFHDAILAFGPVPPSRMRWVLGDGQDPRMSR